MTTISSHRPLPSNKASYGTILQSPSELPPRVTLQSSALCVMTDFRKVQVATITAEKPLAEATETMIARGVRLLLVVDDSDFVIGLITARDTQGERPIQFVHERGGRFADLTVRDLMAPIDDIDLLDLQRVARAEVGDVVATLKHWGRQHALVADVDAQTGATQIRGMFSATQIGRQLGLSVQTFDVARTFAEIQSALTHG